MLIGYKIDLREDVIHICITTVIRIILTAVLGEATGAANGVSKAMRD
jgi:hypothetical protein